MRLTEPSGFPDPRNRYNDLGVSPQDNNGFTEKCQAVPLLLYQTTGGPLFKTGGQFFAVEGARWDELIAKPDLAGWLTEQTGSAKPFASPDDGIEFLPPIGSQEVWAAGVTYYRSRSARMEESSDAGDCYGKVYSAPRPELFFKAPGYRVVGHGQKVRIRGDSTWNVPEPELTVCFSPDGRMVGYNRRQRHEQPRHRRRKPPLPPPGKGL